MALMLDTSVLIPLRDGDFGVETRVAGLSGPLLLSAISRAELEGGVYRYPDDAPARRARLDKMLSLSRVVAFDEACAAEYGRVVAALGFSRRKFIDCGDGSGCGREAGDAERSRFSRGARVASGGLGRGG